MAYSVPTSISTEALLQDLLDISLTAVNLLRPLYTAEGELTDFAPEYFNPAAQRMTGLLSERPEGTARTLFPDIFTNGVFDFYRRVLETGKAGHFEVNYQADGLDNYFRVAAQRSGELLVVSFTDTADQDRSAVELALRESQAAERAARAEVETQRQRFYDLLMQLPAQVAVHEGVDQVFTLVNPGYQRLAPGRTLQGQPIREAWPELVSQGILDVLDQVYHTGEPFVGKELPFQVDFTHTGQLEQVYFNAFFLPLRDAQGQVRGVLDFSTDVTEQVEARQRVEQLNQEAQAARAEAEAERQRLTQVFMRLPANLALLRGPAHVYELVNPEYERLFPGRSPLGRSLREMIPELEGQGFYELFDRVYETGQPYYEAEAEAWADYAGTGEPQRRYYRTSFEPIRNAQGAVTEVLNFAVDVTEQVEARSQIEQLNAELETRVRERTAQVLEQQRLLHYILENVPAAIATLSGPGHHFSFANAPYQYLVGGRAVMGQAVADVLPEVVEQGVIELLDRVYQTGEPFIGRGVMIMLEQPPGPPHQYYYDLTYLPLRDGQGPVQGLLIFAVEVTEQVRNRRQTALLQAEVLAAAQRQAAEREAFYQVFEQTPAAVSLLRGARHHFEYVNPAYQQVFAGRPLVGLDFAQALPDAETQGYLALLDRVYTTGETYFGSEIPFVLESPTAPPHTLYFNFTYQAYRENGKVVGISSFAFDVTEQVLTRQQRETERRQLNELFEQAPVAIAVFRGPEYVIELANLPVCALWGRTQQQALGTPLFDLLPEVAGQGFEQLLDQVRTTGVPFVAHELPLFIDRNGRRETVYWNFVYAPLREADGTIERVTVVATEGTEQVLARRQVQALNEELTATNGDLNESNTQLTRTNVDLDNFIYTASHDLKQPISNIEGLLLALEGELPAAGRVGDVPLMLTMMQGAVERFIRTIDHLTDLSRLQKEYAQPSQQVALAAIIEEVRLDLLPLLHNTQAQLTVELPADLTIMFSEKNLRSVVYNLLSNALKYRHPDRVPQVRLSCQLQGDYQVFAVQDNGLGLDLAQGQEKLFAMFQRLHTHVEGTGVGLHMVKKVVENVGGHIEVESQLGQGTIFRVYFPR